MATQAEIGQQYRSEQFALCAQGAHQPTTKYGVCGIVIAVLLFPLGLIALLVDKSVVCTRCGQRL